MRKVVLDTETTGLDPASGHRVIEIGGVELVNDVPTGQTYQTYLNPERDIPDAAFAIHGLSQAFLADKPVFAAIVDDFLAFIGDGALVIHNAEFDLGFINAELAHLGRPPLSANAVIDTVTLARRKFPGAPANLDALCRRFGIDTTERAKHGALLDAGLLAHVYLELIGGTQPGLGLQRAAVGATAARSQDRREPRPHAPTPEEKAAHESFIATLDDPIWRH